MLPFHTRKKTCQIFRSAETCNTFSFSLRHRFGSALAREKWDMSEVRCFADVMIFPNYGAVVGTNYYNVEVLSGNGSISRASEFQ